MPMSVKLSIFDLKSFTYFWGINWCMYTFKYDFRKYFTLLCSGLTSFFCYKANKRGVILVIFECELKTLILGHRVNPKGQLISKCLFLVSSILPKNEQKQFDLSRLVVVVRSNFFVRILEELRIPKNPYKIN